MADKEVAAPSWSHPVQYRGVTTAQRLKSLKKLHKEVSNSVVRESIGKTISILERDPYKIPIIK